MSILAFPRLGEHSRRRGEKSVRARGLTGVPWKAASWARHGHVLMNSLKVEFCMSCWGSHTLVNKMLSLWPLCYLKQMNKTKQKQTQQNTTTNKTIQPNTKCWASRRGFIITIHIWLIWLSDKFASWRKSFLLSKMLNWRPKGTLWHIFQEIFRSMNGSKSLIFALGWNVSSMSHGLKWGQPGSVWNLTGLATCFFLQTRTWSAFCCLFTVNVFLVKNHHVLEEAEYLQEK